MGKKSKAQDDELDENEEGTDPSHQSDATGSIEVSSDDDGTEVENNSLVYKLKKKIQSLQKGKAKAKSDDDDEEAPAEEDEEAAKKKKKSKLIQYVIIGALVVFVASDYIFPPEEPTPEVKLKPKGKKIKKDVAPADTAATTETPAEDKPADPATDTAATTTETPTTETPVESPVDVTSTEVPTDSTPTDTTPADTTTTTETPVDTTPADTISTAPTDTTTTEPVAEPDTTTTDTAITDTPITDTPIETEPTDTNLGDTQTVTTEDTGTGEATTPGEDNLTDQILQDLEKQAKDTQVPEQKKEYVAPPDYEYRGRGLVYNCAGKHWACVDAPSYKTCEDNSSTVKYLNKKTECHPFNVYETPKGCENVQNRMVSSSAKTAFCE